MKSALSRLAPVVALALVASACAVPLPRIPNAEPTLPALPQNSIIFDDQGRPITSLHAAENRTVIPLSEVPRSVRDAVVAIEDQRFYVHAGVDVKAILRAAYDDSKGNGVVQGASTITEQLVKNTITGNERTLGRKVKDAILAYQVERRYTKAQILEMYLNTVYFGQGAYGIQAAARTYFSVPARKLTLVQGALLAGLIASPSTFDPVFNPELAVARRNVVLARMRALSMIDRAEFMEAVAAKLKLDRRREGRYPAPYFVDYVKRWFLSNPAFGSTYERRYNLLFGGGLRIYTTVDLRLQRLAEEAVDSILTFKADPYGAMTVIDPATGAIRAMVGGRDYFGKGKFAKLNLATGGATGRQAGSSFKPFALVTALNEGFSPNQVFSAPPHINIRLPSGYSPPIWSVNNYEGEGGGSMTLEQATIDSVNTVYAQLIMQEGPGNVVATAHRMGITSPLRAYPSAVLGTNEVNTLDMASAFGSIDTLGRRVPPIGVWRITDAAGRVVYQADPQPKQVVNPGVAWTTLQILQKVVSQGTGTAASFGRPVAGKTGTAQNWTNAWFVGMIPQLVGAVWVGFPQGQIPMTYPRVRLPRVLGGTWPAEIWHNFMVKATRGMPVKNWSKPSFGFVTVGVDVKHGYCLPTRWALPTDLRYIQFYDGTQPTARCSEPGRPQRVALPSVLGMTQAKAESTLGGYGFPTVVVDQPTGSAPEGTVLGQDPAAGSVAVQGTTVTLTVATPLPTPSPQPSPSPSPSPVAVPNVVGMAQDDAVLAMSRAGFNVQVITEACSPAGSCDPTAGVVWQQSPPAGAMDDPGSLVTLWVNPSG